ncbi:MAG: TonB-dependent receptor [Caulobacteraceae bacterium]|nr:TonB-dependent receptor [Caulobacteraceae bacterium]
MQFTTSRNVSRILRGSALGLLACTALTAPAFAQTAAERAQAQPQTDKLDDIVVTARRTEENLQSTPVAVTALGAAGLERAQVSDVTDLQRTAPSLSIATGAPSASGFAFVAIRGQGNTQALVSNDPAVAIYIDGVYVPRPSQGLTDLFDLQRVEVLRGPQGTLFGRNTIGGAVNILSADPTAEFGGQIRVEAGSYDQSGVAGVVNIPLSDNLSARLTASTSDRSGYGHDIPLGRDIGARSSDFVRGKIKYTGDKLQVTLAGDWNKIDDNGQFTALKGYAPQVFGPTGSFGPFGLSTALNNSLHTRGFYDSYATGFFNPSANPNFASLPAEVQALYSKPLGNRLEAYGASLNASLDLGPVTLKSITGYRFSDTDGVVDTDGTPVPILTTWAGYSSTQYSQEFQLSGAVGDKFTYIAGLYYSDEKGQEFSRSQSFAFLPYNAVSRPYAGFAGQNLADVHNTSAGVFGQGYYQLTDAIRIAAGLRWTWDGRETELHNYNTWGVASTCNVATPDAVGVCTQTQDTKFDYPAWTVGIDWQINPEMFAYVQTRGASKSGGWNTRAGGLPAFRPENVRDIEAGFKATWLDNRLRTNIAVFHAWQSDVQRNAAALTPAGASTQFLVNAGDARVYGVEMEGAYRPWSGMELTANVALSDGEYTNGSFIEQQSVPGVGYTGCTVAPSGTSSICPVDRNGEDLPQLVKLQYSLGATQSLPTSFGNVSLHVDYAYLGKQRFSPVTAASQQPAATQAIYAEANRLDDTPAYGLLNAKFSIEFDATNVEFSIYGKNILGEEYLTRSLADFYSAGLGFATDFIGEPQTFGASLTKRF